MAVGPTKATARTETGTSAPDAIAERIAAELEKAKKNPPRKAGFSVADVFVQVTADRKTLSGG